jgi:hypothetical protein
VDAAVFQLFGHMHKRGKLFQIDYVKGGHCSGGDPARPRACGRDDDCACKPYQTTCVAGQTCIRDPGASDTTVYYTTAWDAAPIIDFPAPYFPVGRNEGLRWTCTHVNGVQGDAEYPPKKCEEGCQACGWDVLSQTCRFCKTLAGPRRFWDADLQSCAERKLVEGMVQTVPVADPPRVFAVGDPMPLVFGLLADDDMCNMFGYFIDQAALASLP